MDSMPLREVQKKAEAYDATLLATDPRFRRVVILEHEDGSYLQYDRAFLMMHEKQWLVCFTEHHGFHVYHTDDLFAYSQYERFSALEELP